MCVRPHPAADANGGRHLGEYFARIQARCGLRWPAQRTAAACTGPLETLQSASGRLGCGCQGPLWVGTGCEVPPGQSRIVCRSQFSSSSCRSARAALSELDRNVFLMTTAARPPAFRYLIKCCRNRKAVSPVLYHLTHPLTRRGLGIAPVLRFDASCRDIAAWEG